MRSVRRLERPKPVSTTSAPSRCAPAATAKAIERSVRTPVTTRRRPASRGIAGTYAGRPRSDIGFDIAGASVKQIANFRRCTAFGSIVSLGGTNEAEARQLRRCALHLAGASGGELREHARRVARLALVVADGIRLSDELRLEVALAALLHDIGKAALPLGVLAKPAALDAA